MLYEEQQLLQYNHNSVQHTTTCKEKKIKDYNNRTKDVAYGLITALIKILTKTTVAKDIQLV